MTSTQTWMPIEIQELRTKFWKRKSCTLRIQPTLYLFESQDSFFPNYLMVAGQSHQHCPRLWFHPSLISHRPVRTRKVPTILSFANTCKMQFRGETHSDIAAFDAVCSGQGRRLRKQMGCKQGSGGTRRETLTMDEKEKRKRVPTSSTRKWEGRLCPGCTQVSV